MKDWYLTLDGSGTGIYKDRGSKFLGFAYPVEKEEQVEAHLLQLRKDHPKARHFCYAFRLGTEELFFRTQDDGEPSGTAGRPILGQIDSRQLTNTLVVVVRYFGGTLLGTGGLIQAYRQAAREALEATSVTKRYLMREMELTASYALAGELQDILNRLGFQVRERSFGSEAHFRIACRSSRAEANILQMKALLAKVSLEEAEALGELSGLVIRWQNETG